MFNGSNHTRVIFLNFFTIAGQYKELLAINH